MRAPSRIKVRSLIVCEDIRREDNGKELLLGVFSGIIAAPKLPLKLPRMGFRIEAQIKAGDMSGPTEVLVFGPDRKQIIKIDGEFPASPTLRPGEPFSFSFTIGPVTFEKEGWYVVRWKMAGEEYRAGDFAISTGRHDPNQPIARGAPVAESAGAEPPARSPD
ncbi:hypothetical protein STAQ_40390 [Allostella sp. ATCC 35155]|nr:hypothetical protein STAQ_40390 [Stella sp. ATCC 35155]